RQFEAFYAHHKNGLNPNAATLEDCTDFLHHLYSLGRKTGSVDSVKTALVSFFKESCISPNPAQDMHVKRYGIGLQKYNRQNNIYDEKKAHPLTVHELSTLIKLFANTILFMRRGGCFYRVFESPERKFNFRELMAWCRWTDAKTCCEYLVTRSISDGIDPRNCMSIEQPKPVLPPARQRQLSLRECMVTKSIPTARSGRDPWDQWFTAYPKSGLFCAIKDFTKDMIKCDRRKYSEGRL
ncbi:hypothetical protein DYB30_011013, partial [Aphanomyces astaci]